MFIFWIIVSSVILNNLKKDVSFLQSGVAYVLSLFFLTIFLESGLWFPALILYIVYNKNKKNRRNTQNNLQENNPYYNSFSQGRHSGYNTAPKKQHKHPSEVSNPYNLPKREGGRKKIISKFNKQYNLNLSSQDIQSMASGTYMSIEWASEVYSMDQKYNSFYEWLGQGNSWLRVYLYVFNVQTISPVFNKQEEIVFQSFDTIFSEMCVDDDLPTEVIIQNINNKFLTNFDESTFMLAINYMESKSKRYKYGAPVLTRMHSDIDDLARKYTATP